MNLRLGDVMPLLSSATGRCFAAYASREAIAPLLAQELQRNQGRADTDLPADMAGVNVLLESVRNAGLARVVNTLLPGIAGFCAPVFDCDGHMVLGVVALGSTATFDVRWDGAVARALSEAARRLSSDLGHSHPPTSSSMP